jgi:hypothetical protein
MLPLDYACTQQFVCGRIGKYWLTPFRLDGFGFDQVMGFDNPKFPTKGAPQLIGTLKTYASSQGLRTSRDFREARFPGPEQEMPAWRRHDRIARRLGS